jgi:hypothetical protein
MSKAFDPAAHVRQLPRGGDYLEVKWRLVWLRDKHPDAAIETEMMHHDDKLAVFRARVSIPGAGSATGWGSETPGDFRDYIEKAETKSVGRALAALGFGTQFTGDELTEGERIVDAPVQRQPQPRANDPQTRQDASQRQDAPPPASGDPTLASPKQVAMIRGLARQKAIKPEALEARSSQLYSVPVERLSRRDASDLIKRLEAVPDAESAPPPPDVVAHDDPDTQAMIKDFNDRYPPADLAAKHRGDR